MTDASRRQTIVTEEQKELIDIVNSVLSCELLIHFKIYILSNGLLKQVYNSIFYEALRCYKLIEWVYESESGKVNCLLNVHSFYAFITIWFDSKYDFLPKCKVVLSNSRKELLSHELNLATYSKYIDETHEYIEIVIKN